MPGRTRKTGALFAARGGIIVTRLDKGHRHSQLHERAGLFASAGKAFTEPEHTALLAPYRYVARQPILNRSRRLFGHELLFRSGWANHFAADSESASRTMIDNAMLFGIDTLVGSGIPFINCTRAVLVEGLATLLPTTTVLEVLETVEVDREVVDACHRLKKLGYKLALDDFEYSEAIEPLIPLADYVKIDFRVHTASARQKLLKMLPKEGVCALAEKVETEEEFQLGLEEGFHLFQGYLFAKPQVFSMRSLEPRTPCIDLLVELSRPQFDFHNVAHMVEHDPGLCYRLLRLANSAALSGRSAVTSVENALIMVGETNFRKLALTTIASELCNTQTTEVFILALQRARFCELMAISSQQDGSAHYLFGLLSLLHVMLGVSQQALLSTLALPAETVDALRGADTPLTTTLNCLTHHEQGRWQEFHVCARRLGRSDDEVSRLCVASLFWARAVMDHTSA